MKAKQFPRVLLVGALVVVVGMAFRVSWNALRDVARAIGADPVAALLYGIVVDGLMALALVATLVLVGDDRRFALWVLGGYTAASLVLNYVHGLVGQSADWGRLTDFAPANYALVLLATSLPVGSIYFGSDLVAKVLHHRPTPTTDEETTPQVGADRSIGDLHKSATAPEPHPVPVAAQAGPVPVPHAPTPVPSPAAGSGPVPVAAAKSVRPRQATGRVPASARTTRPARTPAQLMDEARSATADWSDGQLTAERIRKAVHTSAEKARTLRDTLRGEREGRAAEQRHQVEIPELEAAFARLAPGRPAHREALEAAA